MINTILLGHRKTMTKTETTASKMLTMEMEKILISTITKVYTQRRIMDRNINARRLGRTSSQKIFASGYTKSSTKGSHLSLTFMAKVCWSMELEARWLQTPHTPPLQHQIKTCTTVTLTAKVLRANRCRSQTPELARWSSSLEAKTFRMQCRTKTTLSMRPMTHRFKIMVKILISWTCRI